MSDYWVNDYLARPILVIRKISSQGIIQVIEKEIIPDILEVFPNQPTEEDLEKNPKIYRCTLIFDREGYSYGFFERLFNKHRIACIR